MLLYHLASCPPPPITVGGFLCDVTVTASHQVLRLAGVTLGAAAAVALARASLPSLQVIHSCTPAHLHTCTLVTRTRTGGTGVWSLHCQSPLQQWCDGSQLLMAPQLLEELDLTQLQLPDDPAAPAAHVAAAIVGGLTELAAAVRGRGLEPPLTTLRLAVRMAPACSVWPDVIVACLEIAR